MTSCSIPHQVMDSKRHSRLGRRTKSQIVICYSRYTKTQCNFRFAFLAVTNVTCRSLLRRAPRQRCGMYKKDLVKAVARVIKNRHRMPAEGKCNVQDKCAWTKSLSSLAEKERNQGKPHKRSEDEEASLLRIIP